MNTKEKITIIGAGSWGTTLAKVLSENNHSVMLYGRSKDKISDMSKNFINKSYLPNIKLPKTINFTSNLKDAVEYSNFIILVVPSKTMSSYCTKIKTISDCKNKLFLSCTKGFDQKSKLTMSKIIKKYFSNSEVAVLSGPNHAEEIALQHPAATVIAANNLNTAKKWQMLFSNDYFRPYTSLDVIGVEIAGALKNIIAISSGLINELGFGDNSLASLITRGLAEIQRFGMAFDANKNTFQGLAGIGDLIATATSPHSRNRTAGELLANGKSFEEIEHSTGMIIEGFYAIQIVHELSTVNHIDMPITENLYSIIFEHKEPRHALLELMQRDSKKEY